MSSRLLNLKAKALLVFTLFIASVSGFHAGSIKPAQAIFAGGCFWCVEHDFDHLTGVLKTESGYIGGSKKNPTYKQVSAGKTAYIEAVRITYDKNKVSYQQLLNFFWRHIDPTDPMGQFCDKGPQYRAAIFYLSPQQQRLAEHSRAALLKSKKFTKVFTLIRPATQFYRAEDYHQNYYQKNPKRYQFYRFLCGRDQRIEAIWGNS